MDDRAENRNRTVLEAAVALSVDQGWPRLTRDGVAARAGVAAGSVNNAYGTIDGLRDAVMAHAVQEADVALALQAEPETYAGLVGIVAAGIAAGHPAVKTATQALRDAAVATLAAA